MKTLQLFCMLSILTVNLHAQGRETAGESPRYGNWTRLVPSLKKEFYQTPEAIRIAENVLLYQLATGGWPKNINMALELTDDKKNEIIAKKDEINESTIDNGATTTEIEYLSKAYLATRDERYKEAVLSGIRYLLEAQYDNGGWPQFYPRPTGYYINITYNDDAMVNVMKLLRRIYEKETPYDFISDSCCVKIHEAFDKGVECILNTQFVQDGKLTAWCAQYDRETLNPAKARAYELPSLSGAESSNIVLLLMSIPNPSQRIIEAVNAAVKWFDEVKIEGLKRENFINKEGKQDYKMASCTDCPPLWARFYELETNRPFFCDRDGIKVYSVSEIGHERRTGYSWYSNVGIKLMQEYEKYRKK
jgi:pectinesterase